MSEFLIMFLTIEAHYMIKLFFIKTNIINEKNRLLRLKMYQSMKIYKPADFFSSYFEDFFFSFVSA